MECGWERRTWVGNGEAEEFKPLFALVSVHSITREEKWEITKADDGKKGKKRDPSRTCHPFQRCSASIALSSLRNRGRQRKTLWGQFIPLALDLVDSVSLAHACALDKNVHFVWSKKNSLDLEISAVSSTKKLKIVFLRLNSDSHNYFYCFFVHIICDVQCRHTKTHSCGLWKNT